MARMGQPAGRQTLRAARAIAAKSTWAVRSVRPGMPSGLAKRWDRTAWKVSPVLLLAWP